MTGPQQHEWVLELPWSTVPLSLNQRLHWAQKAKKTRAVRSDVGWLLRQQRVPVLRWPVFVELAYQPPDNRRRDRDNLVATFKPCVDALVELGLIPDDSADYVAASLPVIRPKGPGHSTGRFWLTIREDHRP